MYATFKFLALFVQATNQSVGVLVLVNARLSTSKRPSRFRKHCSTSVLVTLCCSASFLSTPSDIFRFSIPRIVYTLSDCVSFDVGAVPDLLSVVNPSMRRSLSATRHGHSRICHCRSDSQRLVDARKAVVHEVQRHRVFKVLNLLASARSATSCARILTMPHATLALKRELAAAHVDDREAYTEGKTAFIQTTLGRPAASP